MEALVSNLDRLITLNNAINSTNAWIVLYRSKPAFDLTVSSHKWADLLEELNVTYKVRADELEEELSLEESTT